MGLTAKNFIRNITKYNKIRSQTSSHEVVICSVGERLSCWCSKLPPISGSARFAMEFRPIGHHFMLKYAWTKYANR